MTSSCWCLPAAVSKCASARLSCIQFYSCVFAQFLSRLSSPRRTSFDGIKSLEKTPVLANSITLWVWLCKSNKWGGIWDGRRCALDEFSPAAKHKQVLQDQWWCLHFGPWQQKIQVLLISFADVTDASIGQVRRLLQPPPWPSRLQVTPKWPPCLRNENPWNFQPATVAALKPSSKPVLHPWQLAQATWPQNAASNKTVTASWSLNIWVPICWHWRDTSLKWSQRPVKHHRIWWWQIAGAAKKRWWPQKLQ